MPTMSDLSGNRGGDSDAGPWPALYGGVVGAAAGTGGCAADFIDLRSLLSCTPKARLSFNPSTAGGSATRQGTTERVNLAVGLAFDRLWHHRPMRSDCGQDADGNEVCLAQLAAVDGYITRYFHRVAELSRESVYQMHQRDILCRMRDDLGSNETSSCLVELDEMISKVNLDDRSLQAEISELMQIALRPGDVALPDSQPLTLGQSHWCGDAAVEASPSSPSPHLTTPGEADLACRARSMCACTSEPVPSGTVAGDAPQRAAVDADSPQGAADPPGASRSVPPCDPCTVQ